MKLWRICYVSVTVERFNKTVTKTRHITFKKRRIFQPYTNVEKLQNVSIIKAVQCGCSEVPSVDVKKRFRDTVEKFLDVSYLVVKTQITNCVKTKQLLHNLSTVVNIT